MLFCRNASACASVPSCASFIASGMMMLYSGKLLDLRSCENCVKGTTRCISLGLSSTELYQTAGL